MSYNESLEHLHNKQPCSIHHFYDYFFTVWWIIHDLHLIPENAFGLMFFYKITYIYWCSFPFPHSDESNDLGLKPQLSSS